MKYVKNRAELTTYRQNPSPGKNSKRKYYFFLILFIFIVFVVWRLMIKPTDQVSPLATEVVTAEIAAETTIVDSESEEVVETIELTSLVGAGYGAIARRGESDAIFTHTIVATLPPVDYSTHFYEGWLVKPGVTDYFSTGEMFPRQDGKYGLVWEIALDEAQSDLNSFTQVVVTRESRDGDVTPETHVLEGNF